MGVRLQCLFVLAVLISLSFAGCAEEEILWEEEEAHTPFEEEERRAGKEDRAEDGAFLHDGLSRADWVQAELLRIHGGLSEADRAEKFARMSASPFGFFRGSNHLFWSDLAFDPRIQEYGGDKEALVWVQGDLHALNFGAFDNDRGDVVYDLNDFDEAMVADYQMDVWRMATSLVLVSRTQGFSRKTTEDVLDAFAEFYLDALDDYTGNRAETRVVFDEDNTYGPLDNFLRDVEDKESREKMLEKWAVVADNGTQSLDVSIEKLEEVPEALQARFFSAMETSYAESLSGGLAYDEDYFRVKGFARRLGAGTGSLGTPRFYALVEGESEDNDDDRILDIKAQGEPTGFFSFSLEALDQYHAAFENHAHRVVVGHRALSLRVDDHLGWMTLDGVFYSVRERSPFKEGYPIEEEIGKGDFIELAEQWGQILAAAHARSDKDFEADLIPRSFEKTISERVDGEHKEFRALVREVAFSYADQVEEDHQVLVEMLETSL